MRLPFRRSRTRGESGASRAAGPAGGRSAAASEEAEAGAAQPAAAERNATVVAASSGTSATAATREAGATTRPTRLRAEQFVDSITHVMAALPSVGPARKAWTKLGFAPSRIHDFSGCAAFDIDLDGSSLRFLAPPRRSTQLPLPGIVADRLIHGAGLLGWSWSCNDAAVAAEGIERASSTSFLEATGQQRTNGRSGPILLPPTLTPGARTMLETGEAPESAEHPNAVTHMDHLVLTVSDVDAATHLYEKNFGLRASCLVMQERRHSYLKVGAATLEIAGPIKPASGPLMGSLWGLAFRSHDLDRTVATLHKNGVRVKTPAPAREGGRITGLGLPLGGIQIAFMGK